MKVNALDSAIRTGNHSLGVCASLGRVEEVEAGVGSEVRALKEAEEDDDEEGEEGGEGVSALLRGLRRGKGRCGR